MSNGRTLSHPTPDPTAPLTQPSAHTLERPGSRRSLRIGAALFGCIGLSTMLTCGNGRDGGEQNLDGDDPNMPTLVSLTLKPNNDVLLVDLKTEATKQFTVRGLFSDGSSADFSRKVKFSLDNNAVGKFTGPTFKSAVLEQNKVDFAKVFAKFNYNGRDLATVANLTIVWLRTSGNSQDFFFNLPYKINPQTKPLTFSTEVQSLDVFFAVDTTGSMGGEINQLTRSLQTVIIPGVKAAAAKDAWFGVGAVDDWPTGSYGSPNCGGGGDDRPSRRGDAGTPHLRGGPAGNLRRFGRTPCRRATKEACAAQGSRPTQEAGKLRHEAAHLQGALGCLAGLYRTWLRHGAARQSLSQDR